MDHCVRDTLDMHQLAMIIMMFADDLVSDSCQAICDHYTTLIGTRMLLESYYCQISSIRRTCVGNKITDHSDVVRASPVGAAPTATSFST